MEMYKDGAYIFAFSYNRAFLRQSIRNAYGERSTNKKVF